MMSHADELRQKITKTLADEKEFLETVLRHSDAYCDALTLSEEDLSTLTNVLDKKFLEVRVGGKTFSLSEWSPFSGIERSRFKHPICKIKVLASCSDDSSLNLRMPRGYQDMSILSEEWHKRLLEELNK